nr:aspartate aminotransferase family protein [Haloarchaeobius salinus]
MDFDTHSESTERSENRILSHWYSPGSDSFNFVEGDDTRVIDDAGNEYLDFVSQLYCVNVGHGNDSVVEAMTEQLETIPYVAPKHDNDARTELAERIASITDDKLSDVLFSISGSEAVELATHIARSVTDSPTILSRYQGYHGATYGSGSLTTDPLTKNTLQKNIAVPGASHFLPPLSHRSPFDADSPEKLAQQAADHVEFTIRNEGPDSVAAIITEVVAGTSGAYTAPPGYFERLREICDKYDCLLIFDEVLTGFGRCGEWFAHHHEGVVPDMVTFAKGVTGGYSPLAGVVVSESIAETIRNDGFDIGQTWGGHPVSCAAGVAAMDEYADGLLENVRKLEPVLEQSLTQLADSHPVVGDVRGRGFLWAVEFDTPGTEEPYFDHRVESGVDPTFEVLATAAKDHGVLFGPGRPTFNLMVAPPFCASEQEIQTAVHALDDAISKSFS